MILQPKTVLGEYISRIEEQTKRKLSLESLIMRKNKEKRQKELEKERLLDLYQSGILGLKDIENRLQRIRKDLKKTDDEMRLLINEKDQKMGQLQLIDQLNEFRAKLGDNLSNLTFDKKKSIVRLLISEVIVDTKKEQVTIRHIVPTGTCLSLRSGSNFTHTLKPHSKRFRGQGERRNEETR